MSDPTANSPLEFPDTLRWGERFLDALTIHAPFDCEPDECVWTGRPDRKDGSAWGVTVLHEKDAPPAVGDTVRIVGRTAEFTAKILYVFNSRRTRVWCLTTPPPWQPLQELERAKALVDGMIGAVANARRIQVAVKLGNCPVCFDPADGPQGCLCEQAARERQAERARGVQQRKERDRLAGLRQEAEEMNADRSQRRDAQKEYARQRLSETPLETLEATVRNTEATSLHKALVAELGVPPLDVWKVNADGETVSMPAVLSSAIIYRLVDQRFGEETAKRLQEAFVESHPESYAAQQAKRQREHAGRVIPMRTGWHAYDG